MIKDKKTRDKAIKNLSLFLSDGQKVITKLDMDKLWKGIFYCAFDTNLSNFIMFIFSTRLLDVWQASCSAGVSNRVGWINSNHRIDLGISFFFAWFLGNDCTRVEWNWPPQACCSDAEVLPNLTRPRIDKYYMLIRRFVNATFRLLLRSTWDKDACQEYNQILTGEGGPLWFGFFFLLTLSILTILQQL